MAVNQLISQLTDTECIEIINLLQPLDKNINKKVQFVEKEYSLVLKDALEYVVTNNPVLWAKCYLDWEARDYQMPILQEGKKSKSLVLRLGRRLGKCLTGNSLILNSETGQYESIYSLYAKQQETNVWSLDINNNKIIPKKTNIILDNGIQDVYELLDKNGRSVICTANHPFYTKRGYVELKDLVSFEEDKEHCDEVAIAIPPEPINAIKSSSASIEYLCKKLRYNDTVNKTIPREVFNFNNKSLAIFLHNVFNIGNVFSSDKFLENLENPNARIVHKSCSKRYIKQLQSLLLRFGIDSKFTVDIKEKDANGVWEYCDHYMLIIDPYTFTQSEIIKDTKYIDRFKKYIIGLEEYNKDDNEEDIIWRPIWTIQYKGQTQTYDLTVPETHNFVVNDFVTHNTDSMCVLILWHAYTQVNKGPNPQYNILIATPYETQIDLIFERLHQMLKVSPVLQALLTRDIQHHLELTISGVKSIILGLTAGANNSAGGANSTRGQRADVMFLDECDYIGSKQITNMINIRNEAPERIKLICASTPSGKREEYYKWCSKASKTYSPKLVDIKNNTFSEYEIINRSIEEDANGWTQVYAPSNVNKELLKINPETERTYLEDIKEELTEMRYEQEVMANFGEEEMGVYQKKYIDAAILEGTRTGHTSYITSWKIDDRKAYLKRTKSTNKRFFGVDWDKVQAGTTISCVEYDPTHTNANGLIEPVFRLLFREEMPRTQFTYTQSVERIIQLNKDYDPEYIVVDRGYGETQIEMLHLYGMEHPETGLAEKVVPIQFSETIEIRDPFTRKLNNTPVKPFMVNNSVKLFENFKIILNPNDKVMIRQLEEYRIERISSKGMPVYTSENEHSIDAMNLGLLIFAQKYDRLLKKIYSVRVHKIDELVPRSDNITSRKIEQEDEDTGILIINTSKKHGVISIAPVSGRRKNRVPSSFSRSIF